MIWTLVLVTPSLLGVWLAARHWFGWAISAASEVLWAAFSITTHDLPLLIMSFIWFGVHCRNAWVTYQRRPAWTWPDVGRGKFRRWLTFKVW